MGATQRNQVILELGEQRQENGRSRRAVKRDVYQAHQRPLVRRIVLARGQVTIANMERLEREDAGGPQICFHLKVSDVHPFYFLLVFPCVF